MLDIADEGNTDGCIIHVISSRDDKDGMRELTEEKLVNELQPLLNARCAHVCMLIDSRALVNTQ